MTPIKDRMELATSSVSSSMLGGTGDAPASKEGVAKEFEKMFVDMMVKSMRQSSKLDEKSNAEDTYQGMLDDEYARSLVENTNFGIRDMILQQNGEQGEKK